MVEPIDGEHPPEPFLPPMRPRRGLVGDQVRLPGPGPRLRRAARCSAGGAMVVLATVWLQNLLDPAPLGDGALVIVILVFPFVFFPFGVTILAIGSWQQRGFWTVVGSPVPWWSVIWRVAIVVAMAVLAVGSFPAAGDGPSGQPMAEAGTFYVNNHGVRTEITEEQYRELSTSWSRGFSTTPMLFAGIALLVLSSPWSRPPPPLDRS